MSDQEKNKNVFVTKDLVSATYMAYNGIRFASGYDKRTRSWVFQDPQKCEELDLKLRNGEAEVEVLKYEGTRRNVLGMVRDTKDTGDKGGHYNKHSEEY